MQKQLHNTSFSLLSNNCNGAFILHDLGMKFNSPFVNLWTTPPHFIKFLRNIPKYLQTELTFCKEDNRSYPVGKLDDIKIYFQHYHSEQEAKQKWEERCKRINFENLFILLTQRDNCTYEHLLEFDQLPFKNKIALTNRPYPEIKSAFYIKGFENEKELGNLFEFSGFNGKKHYDQFPYVQWFNKK